VEADSEDPALLRFAGRRPERGPLAAEQLERTAEGDDA
jgi:hypothetical protein